MNVQLLMQKLLRISRGKNVYCIYPFVYCLYIFVNCLLYLCTIYIFLYIVSKYLCTVSIYLCTISIFVYILSIYLCTVSIFLCTVSQGTNARKVISEVYAFLYCSVLSLGGKVDTRRMSQPDIESIFTKINLLNILAMGNCYVNFKNQYFYNALKKYYETI